MKNIENISNFLSDKKNNYLLINQISDEIGIFYLHVIQYFSTSLGVNINLNADVDNISTNNDLFELKKINVFNTTSTKKIDQILSSNDKSIVFSDYKNFKKYQKIYQTVNGYNFSNDLKTFVKEILKIESIHIIELILYFLKPSIVI